MPVEHKIQMFMLGLILGLLIYIKLLGGEFYVSKRYNRYYNHYCNDSSYNNSFS